MNETIELIWSLNMNESPFSFNLNLGQIPRNFQIFLG